MALPDGIGPLDQLIEKKMYKPIIPPKKEHVHIDQTIYISLKKRLSSRILVTRAMAIFKAISRHEYIMCGLELTKLKVKYCAYDCQNFFDFFFFNCKNYDSATTA